MYASVCAYVNRPTRISCVCTSSFSRRVFGNWFHWTVAHTYRNILGLSAEQFASLALCLALCLCLALRLCLPDSFLHFPYLFSLVSRPRPTPILRLLLVFFFCLLLLFFLLLQIQLQFLLLLLLQRLHQLLLLLLLLLKFLLQLLLLLLL